MSKRERERNTIFHLKISGFSNLMRYIGMESLEIFGSMVEEEALTKFSWRVKVLQVEKILI